MLTCSDILYVGINPSSVDDNEAPESVEHLEQITNNIGTLNSACDVGD